MDIKRICDCCGQDKPRIRQQNNYQGRGFGLFCDDCMPKVREALDEAAEKLGGAYRDPESGVFLCSPRNVPPFYSYAELLKLLEES